MEQSYFSVDFEFLRTDAGDTDLVDYLGKVCDAVDIKGVEQVREEFGIEVEPFKTILQFFDEAGTEVNSGDDWYKVKGSVQFGVNAKTLPPPIGI